MTLETILGSLAAMLTTASFLPQAWNIYKTKDTEAISLWMYIIYSIGVFLWVAYGILIQSWPMVIANAVTMAISLWILWMKMGHK